jgi:hypothetical protein
MSSYLTAPPALQAFLLPYCTMIGLPLFAEVAHISIVTCALSFLLQKISSIMCPILFPATYPKLQAKKDDWVSFDFIWNHANRENGLDVLLISRACLLSGSTRRSLPPSYADRSRTNSTL